MEWIFELLKKNFSVDLQQYWESVFFWRTFALLILLLVVIAYLYRNKIIEYLKNTEINDHDKNIFNQGDSILNETMLNSALDSLYGGHRYYSDFSTRVEKFLEYNGNASNEFYKKKLQKKLNELYKCLVSLNRFLGRNFFYYPQEQNFKNSQYCMYPELNVDQRGDGTPEQVKKYGEYTEQLNKLINDVDRSYKDYRSVVKRKLVT